ncbi:NAD(P)H-dependent flavin oxidoreductase [Cupriavidus basilensis]
MGPAFIATEEANAQAAYKQMIVDSNASDIVYSNLFTGVHGNHLRQRTSTPGSTRQRCRNRTLSKMNFGSGSVKAWKDIWGAGQGVGAIKRVVPAADLVRRFAEEYALGTPPAGPCPANGAHQRRQGSRPGLITSSRAVRRIRRRIALSPAPLAGTLSRRQWRPAPQAGSSCLSSSGNSSSAQDTQSSS